MPANQDMSTSDGLQMARELDPKGERTIGVITKIDIMDRGTNARKMLLGEEIPLKLGYVGVKGRSQLDIKDKMKVMTAIQAEKNYFASHPVYSNLPPGYLGTEALTSKLTTVMYKHIRKVMPDIILEIDKKLYECEKNFKELGVPLPVDDRDKLLIIWRLVSDFTDKVKSSISGDYNSELAGGKKENLGGVRIRLKFNDLFLTKMSIKHSASKKYSDDGIRTALRIHTGNNLPGFTSADAFTSLITPLLEKLKEPCIKLMDEVHAILEQIIVHFINETFMRFPMFNSEVTEAALNVISIEKEKTRTLLDQIIKANVGYTYTKDPEYISVILPSNEKLRLEKDKKKEEALKEREKMKEEAANSNKEAVKDDKDPNKPKEKPASSRPEKLKPVEEEEEEDVDENIKLQKEVAQKKMEKILISEMRTRIDTYFRVVVTQLADIIPKIIGFNLVNSSLEGMHFQVFQKISNGPMFEMLKEPPHIVQKRETLRKMIEVLTNSRKILLRDPDLAYSIGYNVNQSDLLEMREKDKLRKKTAAKERKKSLLTSVGEKATSLGSKIKNGAIEAKNKLVGEKKKDDKDDPPKQVKKVEVPAPAPGPSPPKKTEKTEVDVMLDAGKFAYNNKEKIPTEKIIKAAKDNPELTKKVVKTVVDNASEAPKPKPADKKISSLFGF